MRLKSRNYRYVLHVWRVNEDELRAADDERFAKGIPVEAALTRPSRVFNSNDTVTSKPPTNTSTAPYAINKPHSASYKPQHPFSTNNTYVRS